MCWWSLAGGMQQANDHVIWLEAQIDGNQQEHMQFAGLTFLQNSWR